MIGLIAHFLVLTIVYQRILNKCNCSVERLDMWMSFTFFLQFYKNDFLKEVEIFRNLGKTYSQYLIRNLEHFQFLIFLSFTLLLMLCSKIAVLWKGCLYPTIQRNYSSLFVFCHFPCLVQLILTLILNVFGTLIPTEHKGWHLAIEIKFKLYRISIDLRYLFNVFYPIHQLIKALINQLIN